MSYIEDEQLTVDGATSEFTLANQFKAGTVLIKYNDIIYYDFRDDDTNKDKLVFDFAPASGDEVLVSYYTIADPADLNAIRYITPRQVMARTRNTDLAAESENDIEAMIREAEQYIDIIVGRWDRYYTVADSTIQAKGQKLVFPRYIDYEGYELAQITQYPGIPAQITTAALYAVENLYLNGAPNSSNVGMETTESEKLGDYSYKKTTKALAGNDHINFAVNIIGTRAAAMLKGYARRYGQLTVNPRGGNMNLNSRQQFLKNNR